MFDCEGTLDVNGRSIDISMYKSLSEKENGYHFFRSIKYHLLKYHGIETTNPFENRKVNIRKDGIKTKAIRIKIKRKDSVIRFYRLINFETKEKREKLKIIYDKYNINGEAGAVILKGNCKLSSGEHATEDRVVGGSNPSCPIYKSFGGIESYG